MDDFENGFCQGINERIKARGFRVIHDHELSRVGAPEAALREQQIRVILNLAAEKGLAVWIRESGINATLRSDPHAEWKPD
jgi:hypothetical protein